MSSKNHLTTPVKIPEFPRRFSHSASIFLSGSCFTEHISKKLERYKYKIISNPFGILYNPVSIARSLDRIVKLEYFDPDELVFHNGLYHSMDHHGSFSAKNPDEVLDPINDSIRDAHDHLKNIAFAFISPGTSKVYRYTETEAIVGNCHKLPASAFRHEQLSLSECTSAFNKIYTSLKSIAPNVQVIWTVSPVRHLKDGLIENQQSKATLILSIMEHIKEHPNTGYFPAYEIMVDELRDYRFYNSDMTHPSPLAIEIIWETFENAFMHHQSVEMHPIIEKVKRAMEHRILHDNIAATKTFAEGQIKNIDQLQERYPDLNWENERSHFEALIEKE
jgi:hypothetical protein